jgi:hypothetical protein
MATPTALPASFTSGQVLTASDTNLLRGAFRVLQVKQTSYLLPQSSTSATLTDITGITVSITPQYTSSQILVTVNLEIGFDATADDTFYQLFRGSTAIAFGNTATITNSSAYLRGNASANQNLAVVPIAITFLDSPSTTSATTYKMQWATRVGTVYLNRRGQDQNFVTASSITVQEISA